MTYSIEVLVLPVSDVDRARAFWERGFRNQPGSAGA